MNSICVSFTMKDHGKRKVQARGQITLPQKFREENEIESGDHVSWNIHSKNRSKLINEKKND